MKLWENYAHLEVRSKFFCAISIFKFIFKKNEFSKIFISPLNLAVVHLFNPTMTISIFLSANYLKFQQQEKLHKLHLKSAKLFSSLFLTLNNFEVNNKKQETKATYTLIGTSSTRIADDHKSYAFSITTILHEKVQWCTFFSYVKTRMQFK